MKYSVEDVTKLANVSVRTLHYYDEIGLLKPSARMESGRRYYSGEEVSRLTDIIFFKKMGFSLKRIESILSLGNKDKRALMMAKKEFLQKEMQRIKELVKSIDETLEFYFKGENMNVKQMIKQFESFQKSTQEDKQSFLEEFGSIEDEEEKKLKKMNVKEQLEYFQGLYKNADLKQYGEKLSSLFQKLIEAIDSGLKEDSQKVQKLMKEYFATMELLYPMSKKKWLDMGVTISEDQEAYVIYAKMHPKLPEFLAKAIRVYGAKLKK